MENKTLIIVSVIAVLLIGTIVAVNLNGSGVTGKAVGDVTYYCWGASITDHTITTSTTNPYSWYRAGSWSNIGCYDAPNCNDWCTSKGYASGAVGADAQQCICSASGGYPDLTVEGIISDGPLVANEVSTFNVYIRNDGDASASNVRVNFYRDDLLMGDALIPSIVADGLESVAFAAHIPMGEMHVEAVVDPYRVILESNETNNEYTQWHTVPSGGGGGGGAGGSEFYMIIGDTASLGGHNIWVQGITDSAVDVSVDGGEVVAIYEGNLYTWPEGIEVRVLDIYPASNATSLMITIFSSDGGDDGPESDPECADIVEMEYLDYSGSGLLDCGIVYVHTAPAVVEEFPGAENPKPHTIYSNKVSFGKQRLLFNDVNSAMINVRICEGNAYNGYHGGGIGIVVNGETKRFGDVIISYAQYLSDSNAALLRICGD